MSKPRKYSIGEIIGTCYKLRKFLGGNNWEVECIICGKVQVQSIGNIKRHKIAKCYYCTHPHATQNRPSGKGQLVYSVTDRYYNYYKSKIEDQNKSAKRKYKAFELTLEEFSDLVTKPCYYCGSEPTSDNVWNKSGKRKTISEEAKFNGIDRIDSNIGYIKDNCVPCCKICNRMKSDLTTTDFWSHINRLYNIHFNKSSTTIERHKSEPSRVDSSESKWEEPEKVMI